MSADNTIDIDEKKLKLIIMKLIILEKDNNNTRRYNSAEIIKKIKRIIEEEVACY